jgi:hypothetical protein
MSVKICSSFFHFRLLPSSLTIAITMPPRQQGRSYLGVLDCDSGSVSMLDIPFSDLSNVVRVQIFITTFWIQVYKFCDE